MSTNESIKAGAIRRLSWRTAVNWLLVTGIVLALGGNLFQFIRQQRLQHDLDLGRRSAQRQIQDVKDAVSGILQQNALRYDALNKQLQAISTTGVHQARPEVKRNDSELVRTFARRQQDVATQLSGIRSELRQDTATKLTQLSNELQKTNSDLHRVATQMNTKGGNVESNSEEVEQSSFAAAPAPPEPEQIAVVKKKKRFWSKLNPFHRKKSASSGGDAVE